MTEYSGCFKQLIKCSNIEFYLFVWKFKRNDSLMYGLAPIRFPPFAAEVRSKHEKAMDWEHSTGRQNWYSDENHWNLSSKPSSRTWLKYIFFNTGMERKKSRFNSCLHNNISKEVLSTWRDAWGHNYVSQFNILSWASQSSWTPFKAAFAFFEMCVKCWKVVSHDHETVIADTPRKPL